MPKLAPLTFQEPMAAKSAPPPSLFDPGWLYEVKFDGFRVLAIKNGREVELWSRNHKPLNARFPTIVAVVRALKEKRCLLDGEVCALDPNGRTSFQLLQNAEEHQPPIIYYVFDLLVRGARDLKNVTLTARKEQLAEVLKGAGDPIRLSAFSRAAPSKVLAKMQEVGLEGAIAKRADSLYEPGRRTSAWVKIKFQKSQEFVVAGYTLPQKSRRHFGALILGVYVGSRLIFAGRVGTGFTEKSLREIHRRLGPLEIDAPQIANVIEPSGRWRGPGWKPSQVRWVKPQLVAQVTFTEWTSDGVLRHPSFQGWREDKAAQDVVREEPS